MYSPSVVSPLGPSPRIVSRSAWGTNLARFTTRVIRSLSSTMPSASLTRNEAPPPLPTRGDQSAPEPSMDARTHAGSRPAPAPITR